MNDMFESHPTLRPIPQQRVIAKMDEYMARRDYAGAERHLLYWLEEARAGRDQRGMLMVLGELVGHYRKTGERDKAMAREEGSRRYLGNGSLRSNRLEQGPPHIRLRFHEIVKRHCPVLDQSVNRILHVTIRLQSTAFAPNAIQDTLHIPRHTLESMVEP